MFIAGFLAAGAAMIELQVAPVSAILGIFLVTQCLRGARRSADIALFAVGASIPTLILLTYNQLAFGSPWDMGYFHHDTRGFAAVHNRGNPLGLVVPNEIGRQLESLLWGRFRGLLFYAPILLLAVPGWVVLLCRRSWEQVTVTFLVVGSMLLVNVFYPEWTGGWSTGPRLLLPIIPFAMLPVAALLATNGAWHAPATIGAVVLALAGGVEMLLFQGVDGRVPQFVSDPLFQAVWPLWMGQPVPEWRYGERFCPNLVSLVAPGWVAQLDATRQSIQFLPLALGQLLAILCVCRLSLKSDNDRNPSADERVSEVIEYRAESPSDLGIN
jgi:hypothetical protein